MRSLAVSIVFALLCAPAAGQLEAGGQSKETVPVALNVHLLLTSWGADASPDGLSPAPDNLYADRYPTTIHLEAPTAISNRISAYGAGFGVWIAPMGWTGTGAVGGDGSTAVDLHPMNGSGSLGPRFHYENSGGCEGCALYDAAPYFPSAMKSCQELFSDTFCNKAKLPPSLKIVRVSEGVLKYSLSDTHGLMTRGVVLFQLPDPLVPNQDVLTTFTKAEFVLPRKDAKLVDFLLSRLMDEAK